MIELYNYTLLENLLLIAGSQAVDLTGPLVVGGFPLAKGRIHTTKHDKVRGPQGPQCCDVLSILECLQELRNPEIMRLGLHHRSHWVIWPYLDGSTYSGSTLRTTHFLPQTAKAPFYHHRGCILGSMVPPSTVPSWVAFELPTPHQPHYQILSVHHDSSITGSSGASLPTPGVQQELLISTPFGLDLNCHQIDPPVKTTSTHGEWGGHQYPG